VRVGHNPMGFFEYSANKELIVRLKHDADLVQSMTELVRSRELRREALRQSVP